MKTRSVGGARPLARAQEQLKKNKAFSRRNLRREREYLRCLVKCGVCGRGMVAHSRTMTVVLEDTRRPI